MWRVSALDRDGREIGHFELADGELGIGRDTDRQLVLPSASVSRRHAKIVIANGRPCIIDEGSSNGVLINGVRISEPTAIGPSTRIDVAEFRIAIEPMQPTDGAPALPPPGPVPTPMPVTHGAGMRLVAEGGPYDGRVYSLAPGILSVGRAVDNDLVYDDPSLSRRHARVIREAGKMEVEDLGSSNGTYVNGRKIGRAGVNPGDIVRFGDLNFRCEGNEYGSTRSVEPGMPRLHLYALLGGAGATFLILLLAVIFLVRKVPPVQASGRDAIARINKQADAHLAAGKKLYGERKYPEAKAELDLAYELDPANADVRHYRQIAAHGAEDDRALASATGALGIGDRKGLESAFKFLGDISDGSPARVTLANKLEPAMVHFGSDTCARRDWLDCAWAMCKAFEIAPADAKGNPQVARSLKDAEHKLKRAPSYVPCRAAPP